MDIKKCRVCGIKLNDENWASYSKKKNHYICKKCRSEKSKVYYLNHIEEYKKYSKEWCLKNKSKRRQTRITSTDENGKNIYIKCEKRERPNVCEICNKERKLLSYHHWIKNNPSLGIWICSSCHFTCNILEKISDIEDKYLKIKNSLEKLYDIR